MSSKILTLPGVALRKESVDRNMSALASYNIIVKSLSARRAWIEISGGAFARPWAAWSLSARRAWIEIVGRSVEFHLFASSLSARRAWIEIAMTSQISVSTVSLSARRAWIEIDIDGKLDADLVGRSPQGERG